MDMSEDDNRPKSQDEQDQKRAAQFIDPDKVVIEVLHEDISMSCYLEIDAYAGKKKKLGWIWAAPSSGAMFLSTISVHPSYWRQGVGSLLLKKLVQEARKRGCVRIYGRITPRPETAEKAARFFAKNGFTVKKVSHFWEIERSLAEQ
jgi:GNAT superfamily N-acetyltransferase